MPSSQAAATTPNWPSCIIDGGASAVDMDHSADRWSPSANVTDMRPTARVWGWPSKRRWPSHKAAPGRGWQMQLRRVRSTTQLLDDFEIVRTRPGIDGDIGHRMELGRPIEVFREHVGLNRSGVEELREQFRKMFPKRHPA
jgi:hypothetical protein